MTGLEIVKKAQELKNYKYWYGAKGQKASKELALTLKKNNPGVWTDAYFNKAMKDVNGIQHVGDCSYLVCYAYGISQIGSYQIEEKYKDTYTNKKSPAPGMILWKKGHVGILAEDGKHVIELAGIDGDFRTDRTIQQAGFTKILYDPEVDYTNSAGLYGHTGWEKDDKGWWYIYSLQRGCYYKNCKKDINGRTYYFDEDGYAWEKCE